MKIIRLSTFLDFGGIEKRMSNLSYAKDDNFWIFCAIGKGGKAEEIIKLNNKEVHCFNLQHKIPSFKTICSLYKFFKKEKPDVVHTSGAEANFHGIIAAKFAGVPRIIGEEIGMPNQSKLVNRLFSWIFYITDYVAGNSKVVLEYLHIKNGVKKEKLVLIPNPLIFPKLTKVNSRHPEVFKIITVSRLEPIKNLESVLRVVLKLKNEGFSIKYTMVGDGILFKQLSSKLKEMGLDNEVCFSGFQPNPYPFLMNSDLYLLTSFTEGFSNSLVEAMYAGVPSLSTTVGAAEEIIQDGINGFLIPPNDDGALYLKIKNIINLSEEVLQGIALKGKETVTVNYSLEAYVENLMKIYKL